MATETIDDGLRYDAPPLCDLARIETLLLIPVLLRSSCDIMLKDKDDDDDEDDAQARMPHF